MFRGGFFFSLVFLMLLSGCDAPELVPLAESDKILVTVTTTNSGKNFVIQAKTLRSYGCEAALSVRSGRNFGAIYLDIAGVLEGTEGCGGTPALGRTESFQNITSRIMTLEIWYNGAVEKFTLRATGARIWSVDSTESVFSDIEVVNN